MLKDILEKIAKNKKDEKIPLSLIDGYVDVKAYKHEENGEKKLIYHNTGDNTVTNWMRQVIMLLLSGYSLSTYGSTKVIDSGTGLSTNIKDTDQFSKPSTGNHSDTANTDGYCLNGKQYLGPFNNTDTDNSNSVAQNYYPVEQNTNLWSSESEELYALFPTKILLGTGCEYTDWDSLKEFNETDNATWYADIVQQYGNGDEATAKTNFNTLVGADGNDNAAYGCNVYSGTVGIQGNYTGNGSILPAITVNDPDTTSNITSSADMAKRFGVVGAVKTLYLPSGNGNNSINSMSVLESTVSDSGRLIQGQFRGAGRPCFVYFRRNSVTGGTADWDQQTSDVFVSKDSESAFLNRITFRIVIPAQSSGTAAVGEYNPFNGYTFKQVGLFNDAKFATDTSNTESVYSQNMPCGTLLAIKNIQSFTKTADESIEFTWTLTI